MYGYLRHRIDGAKTYDVTGNYVGRVREFFIEPAEAPNRVSHYCCRADTSNRWWPNTIRLRR